MKIHTAVLNDNIIIKLTHWLNVKKAVFQCFLRAVRYNEMVINSSHLNYVLLSPPLQKPGFKMIACGKTDDQMLMTDIARSWMRAHHSRPLTIN